MQTKPILVVMAAGMGSRYGGLKQIDPVGPSGEAILDYSLYDARRAGVQRPSSLSSSTRSSRRLKRPSVPVPCAPGSRSATPTSSWKSCPRASPCRRAASSLGGTAHAILVAEEAIGDAPFAVINADDYYARRASSSSMTT